MKQGCVIKARIVARIEQFLWDNPHKLEARPHFMSTRNPVQLPAPIVKNGLQADIQKYHPNHRPKYQSTLASFSSLTRITLHRIGKERLAIVMKVVKRQDESKELDNSVEGELRYQVNSKEGIAIDKMKNTRQAGGHPAHIPKTGGKHPSHIPKGKAKPLHTKAEAIAKIPFFQGLDPEHLGHLEPYFQEYRFRRGQYLFWEDDPANKIYVIKSGRVRLLKMAASGKEMVLEVMVPGQICGGTTLFGSVHRNGAQAVEQTIVYGMSRDSYDELLGKYPEIARGIIKYLGGKLMDAHDVIISLVSSKVESRIAAVIVRLCENHGSPAEDGILINIRLTRQDIADIVGSTVETTIRIISKFQKEGLLDTIKGRLLVKDLDSFKKMMKAGGPSHHPHQH